MRAAKWCKDAAIGLGVTALLGLGAEALLWVLDVGEPVDTTPISRGFDPSGEYLVPDPDVPGGYRTQFGDGQLSERHVSPKGDRLRVVLFGGSNTQGFPSAYLERELERRAGTPAYEVVNLGRSGYGSERVAVLFEQALELLEPDVVVLYTGHNEFMERSFKVDLDGLWAGDWLRAAGELARGARTVNLVAGLFRGSARPGGHPPAARAREEERFVDLPYAKTLEYLDVYRDNLRAMCARARERGVGVVLCTVVYNRLSAPYGTALPPELGGAERERFEELRARALEGLPLYLVPLLPTAWSHRLYLLDWIEGPPVDGPAPEVRLPGRRPCGPPLAGRDPLLPDPRRHGPKVASNAAALERLFARDFSGTSREGLERAEADLEAALAIAPDHPRALFELALVELLLEREPARVRELLELAGRYDRGPRRANAAIDDRVREVAAELSEVALLDADGLFAGASPDGIVGWEWMLDHCHLTAGGARIVMEALAELVVERWPAPRTAPAAR